MHPVQVEDMEDGATFTTMVDDNSEQVTIDKHSTPGRPIVVGANRAAYIIQPNIADQQVRALSICRRHRLFTMSISLRSASTS